MNDTASIVGGMIVVLGISIDLLSLLTLLLHRRRGERSSGFPLLAPLLYGPVYLLHGPFLFGYEELALLALFHVFCQGAPYLLYRDRA